MITVQCTVNVPIDKVWEFWIVPEHIIKWNNASEDWHTPKAINDLKVGGKFCYTMAAKDESMRFDFEGEYTNFKHHSIIEYKLDDNRLVKITFEAVANGVIVSEYFDAEEKHSGEMQRQGWQAILNNFKNYTEKI